PWILVNVLVKSRQAKQSAPRVMRVAAAVPASGMILFVIVLVRNPVIHKQGVIFPGVLQRHFIEFVAIDGLVEHVIRRTPNVAAPIELVGEPGVVARNRGSDIRSPELLGV